MAVISKIRNQSGLLIGSIGVAMLLFVVGGDFLGSGGSFFSQPDNNVGAISDNSISYEYFEQRVAMEINSLYGNQSIDDNTKTQVRDRVWNQLVQELVIDKEYDKLGVNVTPDELYNAIKNNDPVLRSYFSDPQTGQVIEQFANPATGGLDSEKVLAYIKQLNANGQGAAFIPVEQAIKNNRLNTKYNNLIKSGIITTTVEANADYLNSNKKVDFSFVVKEYALIDESEISYDDSDLKAYYNAHKAEDAYQNQFDSRSIDYVVWEVTPSENDIARMNEEMNRLKEAFAASTSDTLFVIENTENPNDPGLIRYYTSGQLPYAVDTTIFNAEVGTVIGPIVNGNQYSLYKKLAEKVGADSVRASHILLPYNGTDSAAVNAKGDSLLRAAKGGADFADLAREFSTDQGSAANGGDLNWFTEGQMVAPFNDACFNGNKGDYTTAVSQFGLHIIYIADKTAPKEKVLAAAVKLTLEPGNKTYDMVFNQASEFSISNNNAESFKTAANEFGMRKADNIKEDDEFLAGFESPRTLIRWIYDAEVGDISEPFELGNKYVVAHLNAINEKGTLSFEAVKELVKEEVIKEKKAEYVANLVNGKSLEEAASALGVQVEKAPVFNFASYAIPGQGTEQKVIGETMGLNEGETSGAIVGDKGVFVTRVDKVYEAPEKTDFTDIKTRKNNSLASRTNFEVNKALKEVANITDNRSKFY